MSPDSASSGHSRARDVVELASCMSDTFFERKFYAFRKELIDRAIVHVLRSDSRERRYNLYRRIVGTCFVYVYVCVFVICFCCVT